MEMNADLLTFVLVITLEIIFFVVWLVRLEGRVNYIEKANDATQKDVDVLRGEHQALNSRIVEELAKVRESLAELKGYLSGKDKNNGDL